MHMTDPQKKAVAAAALFAVLASITGGLIYVNGLILEPLLPGERVPSLNIIRAAQHDTLHRRAVLFVSPVCRHCVQALDRISGMNGAVLRSLTVFVSGTEQETAGLRARFPLPFIADPEGNIARSFRNSIVPALYLIDEQGILRHRPNIRAFHSAESLLITSFLADPGRPDRTTTPLTH